MPESISTSTWPVTPLAFASSHAAATVYPGGPLPGRLACLPYVREQSVSLTAHRFGHASRIQLDL